MALTTVPNDMRVKGHFSSDSMNIPDGTVRNQHLASDADLEVEYMQHIHTATSRQASGADIADRTELVYCCKTSAEVVRSIWVTPDTSPTGGDKLYTIDVKKSTGAGAFATILSAVKTIDATGEPSRTPINITSLINGSAGNLVAGDVLEVVWDASGSTGSQGQGGLVEIEIDAFTS